VSSAWKLAIVLLLSAAALAGAWLLRGAWGTELSYTHFLYVPIALASMWWGFWGLAVAAGLAALVLLLNFAGLSPRSLGGDLARLVLFHLVAFFIALLRRRLVAGQESLKRSEQNYRQLIEQARTGVYVSRGERRLFANERLCRLLGRPVESLRGSLVWELFHEGDREQVRALASRGEENLRWECRLLRAAPAPPLWVEATSATATYLGEPAVLVNVYDISQRRELAELARRQEEQLEHSTRLAELGEMAAAISHELNQPLTGIRNYARNSFYMIDRQVGSVEEVKENLRLISEQVDRASKIINQMRELTRRSDRQFARLDLNSVIRESVDFLLPQMKLSEIRLTLTLSPELPEIRGDRIRLSQVFLNLLTNARQAMENSLERELAVRSYRSTHPELPVVVQVADSGKGFSAEEAPKLFVPFFTTKARGQGTGLGLSISRSIVQDHGGTIEATGVVGKGATFTLRLPAAREPGEEGGPQ